MHPALGSGFHPTSPAIIRSGMKCRVVALLMFSSFSVAAENVAPEFATANPSFGGFDVHAAERSVSQVFGQLQQATEVE